MSCAVVKVGSVQLRECELNYNSAAQCSDTRGRQLTSNLIGVLQVHQSSFPTWFRSLLIGQLGTRFKAKGAIRVGGAMKSMNFHKNYKNSHMFSSVLK